MSVSTVSSFDLRQKYIRALYFLLNGSFPDRQADLLGQTRRVIENGLLKNRSGLDLLSFDLLERGELDTAQEEMLFAQISNVLAYPARQENLARLGVNARSGLHPKVIRKSDTDADAIDALLSFERKPKASSKKAPEPRRRPTVAVAPVRKDRQMETGGTEEKAPKRPSVRKKPDSTANAQKAVKAPSVKGSSIESRAVPAPLVPPTRATAPAPSPKSTGVVPDAEPKARAVSPFSSSASPESTAGRQTAANIYGQQLAAQRRMEDLQQIWEKSELSKSVYFDLGTVLGILAQKCHFEPQYLQDAQQGRMVLSEMELRRLAEASAEICKGQALDQSLWRH